MNGTIKISAYISEETKNQIKAYVKNKGVKKDFLLEEALQHYLQVLRDIPEELIIPSRLVLTEDAMKQVAARLTSDELLTDELKELFSD